MDAAATTTPEPVYLHPRQTKKDTFELALMPMPAGEGLREGETNRLRISLRYLKDGMGRNGRGFYVTLNGHTSDGTFESHMLFQDPAVYIFVEPAARFSAKKFAACAERLRGNGDTLADTLAEHVAKARAYYENRKR